MSDDFQQAVEQRLATPDTAYGFPVKKDLFPGVRAYFKANKHVAGMVWGGGANESPPDEPYSIVLNPYAPNMQDPASRDAVLRIEAARILMRQDPIPAFEITPAMQAWRAKTFKPNEPFYTDDQAFRETLVSRVLVGDHGTETATPEVQKIAARYAEKLQERSSPVRRP